MMKQTPKAASVVIFLFELGLLCLLTLGSWLLSLVGFPQDIVVSGLLGGLIFILPSAYFAHYAFRHSTLARHNRSTASLGEGRVAIEHADSSFLIHERLEPKNIEHEKLEEEQLTKVARSFYQGEIGKFVLTVMSFAVVFRFYPTIDAISLFSVFGIMTVTHWWIANEVTQRLYEASRTA